MEFKKKFIDIKKDFDFNEMTKLINEKQFTSNFASSKPVQKDYVLDDSFKINQVQNEKDFREIFFYLNSLYNKNNHASNLCIFFSLMSGSNGSKHSDREDVALIGLYGKTLYIINDNYYILEKGDLLFIDKGIEHKAVSLEPRIVLSYGVFPNGDC